jgi:hypothetical protein
MKKARPINAEPNEEAIKSLRVPDGIKSELKKSNPNLNLSPEKVKSITDVDSSFWGIKQQQSPTTDASAPLTDGEIPTPTDGM